MIKFKAILFSFFLSLSILTQLHAATSPDGFDPKKTCKMLLKLARENDNRDPIFEPAPLPGSKQEAFINFYLNELVPAYEELGIAGRKYLSYDELVDAGLYDGIKRRRKQWQGFVDRAQLVFDRYSSSPSWEAKKRKWAQLAEGLTGDLADSAREGLKELEFSHFPPEAQPLLKMQFDANTEIDRIANTSPLKLTMQDNQVKRTQITQDFFAQRISFADAAKELERLAQEGALAYGADIATRAKNQLNLNAKIQTQLVQMKGYKTNTDFVLASQADEHAPQFQGKENVLKFLYGLLESTDNAMRRYYELRAKQVTGSELQDLLPSALGLLGFPAYILTKDYFPKENLVEIWHRTMRESGFSEDVLSNITVDAFPRENKNNHAYMLPLRTPSPRQIAIDGNTLNLTPSKDWSSARIYILQNFIQDGLGDLETAFHEGGHGLDYSYQRDHLGHNIAYGLTETHSMTMEHFMGDREFLLANGKMRDGTAISEEIVDLFIKRRTAVNIASFRGIIESAIYDIELWDYDYANGPQTFVERSLELSKKLQERVDFIKEPADIKFGSGYSNFITSHFRSGGVRHYGYVLAEVAAALMASSLYDKMAATTGRRSLYMQPTLGPLLSQGIYEKGMFKPFPLQVEEFTGKSFSPENFAKDLVNKFNEYVNELERASAPVP